MGTSRLFKDHSEKSGSIQERSLTKLAPGSLCSILEPAAWSSKSVNATVTISDVLVGLHTRHISGSEQQVQTSVDQDPEMPTPAFTKNHQYTTGYSQYVEYHGRHASNDWQSVCGCIYSFSSSINLWKHSTSAITADWANYETAHKPHTQHYYSAW